MVTSYFTSAMGQIPCSTERIASFNKQQTVNFSNSFYRMPVRPNMIETDMENSQIWRPEHLCYFPLLVVWTVYLNQTNLFNFS